MPLTKEKKKLSKLIHQSDSEDSEHELSHYVNDRVKLMKEVLKTIKPKRIKAMAPACLKNLDMEEINSMLLEELLGISNKRLKYIFNGQNLDEDSSSTDEEPIDVISLDDISDEDFVNLDDDDAEGNTNAKRVKKELRHRRVKQEKIKHVKTENSNTKKKQKDTNKHKQHLVEEKERIDSNENLMSVLELLELQARARAIKSQLLLENAKTQESISTTKKTVIEDVESDDDVIIATTKTEEIVITSSESDDETNDKSKEQIETSPSKVNNIETLHLNSNESNCDIKEANVREHISEILGCENSSEKSVNSRNEGSKVKESNSHITENNGKKVKSLGNTVESRSVEKKERNKFESNVIRSAVVHTKISEDPVTKSELTKLGGDKEEKNDYQDRKHNDSDEIIVINLSDEEMNNLK